MYVFYTDECVESVQGDIDICFVYCWGVVSLRADIVVCFVYCWVVFNRYEVIYMYVLYIVGGV